MESKINSNQVLITVEVTSVVTAILLCIFWAINPQGNYEPFLVLISFILIPSEIYRRRRTEGVDEKLDNLRSDILERITEEENKKNIPKPGTRVRIKNSNKITQKDKLTEPCWFAKMDAFSDKETKIKGYKGGYYMLEIDDGKNIWPGRWLTKI